jgi:hypothetical protein
MLHALHQTGTPHATVALLTERVSEHCARLLEVRRAGARSAAAALLPGAARARLTPASHARST